jgi:bifunctional DNA-binding transcriptional regulator/antitoxin component of YhaV-PrlF toxin-antitoxin module
VSNPAEATADPDPIRTDGSMPSGLDTARHTAHRVAAIRAPFPGVDTLAPRPATEAPAAELAPVVHIADRAPRPVRDGAARWGAIVPLDAQNRLSLGKALARLGWDETTFLVAVRDGGRVVVRAADDSPEATPVPVDGDRRLTLPPGVLAILGVRRGDQVFASAVLDTGELYLAAAADVLQEFTGPVPTAPAKAIAVPAVGTGRGSTPRWQPRDGRRRRIG